MHIHFIIFLASPPHPTPNTIPNNTPQMIGLEAGTNFSAICFDEALRKQASWDFLVCEGHSGWAAIHITSPLLFYLVFQRAWLVVALHALWECLEVLLLALFGDYILFATNVTTVETIASSLLGDVLISGTLGIVLGMLLVSLLGLAPLFPIITTNLKHNEQHHHHPHYQQHYHLSNIQNSDDSLLALKIAARQWGVIIYLMILLLPSVLVSWVEPASSCLAHYPYTCRHIGIIVFTLLQGALLISLRLPWCWKYHYSTTRIDWSPIIVVWVIILIVNAQTFQPWVPLYLGPTGGFTQPWLAASLLILLLVLILAWRCTAILQVAGQNMGLYVGAFFLLLIYMCRFLTGLFPLRPPRHQYLA